MTIAKYNIGRVYGPYQLTFITTEALLFKNESLNNLVFEITLYCITSVKGGRNGAEL